MEVRTRSSVYATTSHGPSIDLQWLLADANTVYLCAPIEDQPPHLRTTFGGLLNDLIAQAYRARRRKPPAAPSTPCCWWSSTRPARPRCEPPPEYASTLAGIGVLLVTIWQSLAQIEASCGRDCDTIPTNHLTKVFYADLSDPASLRYVA